MGLDMYLYAEQSYRVKWSSKDKDEKGDELLKFLNFENKYTFDGGMARVKIPVAYWRKANAIHRYFIQIRRKELEEQLLHYNWFSVFSQEEAEQYKEVIDKILNRLEDDCNEFYVAREDLENLLDICSKITQPSEKDDELIKYWTLEKVNELLPTQSGFFFGSTEYDEWYFSDLRKTQQMLEKILSDYSEDSWVDFYYRASW